MESITFEISLYIWLQIADFRMSACEPSVGCLVEQSFVVSVITCLRNTRYCKQRFLIYFLSSKREY